jgi:hypothetical protein
MTQAKLTENSRVSLFAISVSAVFFLITIACCCNATTYSCGSQGYWSWKANLGPIITSVIQASDGNLVVAGWTFASTSSDGYLAKLSPFGDTIWTKTIGQGSSAPSNGIYGLCSTSDGNLMTAGGTFGIRKISTSDGSILWEKIYFAAGAYAITPTADGNFMVVGNISLQISNTTYEIPVYILKINPNGDSIWTRKYSRYHDNEAFAIAPTLDGNYIIVGNTDSTGIGFSDLYFLKIKPDGDTVWTRTFHPALESNANSISPTADGNFIVAGDYNSQHIYLLKINDNGDTIWTRVYDNLASVAAYVMRPTLDGNFIVAGDQELIKVKPNGDIIWTRTCGSGSAMGTTEQGDIVISETLGYSTGSGGSIAGWLFYLTDDKYAYKNSLFTYRIPIYGDSLKYTYSPHKMPDGMTVSHGGTISWTPTNDSSYTEHDTFFVSNQAGKKDTLSLNIIVNSQDVPNKIVRPLTLDSRSKPNGILVTSYSSFVSFSLSVKSATLGIYDIHGRLVARLPVVNGAAVWRGTGTSGNPVSAGRYFARVMDGEHSITKAFLLLR